MVDNLGKVMERLRSSQPTKEIIKKKPIEKLEEVQEEEVDEDIEEEEEEDIEEEEEKPVKKTVIKKAVKQNPPELEDIEETKTVENEQTEQERKAMEIELLQNNGIFRAEMLFQLGQINQNLYLLNSLIKGLIGGKDGKN